MTSETSIERDPPDFEPGNPGQRVLDEAINVLFPMPLPAAGTRSPLEVLA